MKLIKLMILLKITNSFEVVAERIGRFMESMTPDWINDVMVGNNVIKEIVFNLASAGLEGEVAAVNGVEVEKEQLILREVLKVQKSTRF